MKSQKVRESKNECETSGASIDGQKDVTVGDNKPKAYTFTKSAGSQFNLLPDAEPLDYFSFIFQ
jgi:hypothetical protein